MPEISVVIPTYNCARWLPEAIDSVVTQNYPGCEIVVVDDGSTDNTREVLRKYEGKINYVWQKNRGEAGARNAGIRAAHGEYIAFLDADDIWLPDKLAIQMPLFERNPRAGLVYGNFLYIDESGKLLRERKGKWYRGRVSVETLFNDLSIWVGTVIVRKECFKKTGLFDESLKRSPDVDMWLRIAAFYEIDYTTEPVAKYRQRAGSLMRNSALVREEALNRIERNYQRFKETLRVSERTYLRIIEKTLYRVGKSELNDGERRLGRDFLIRSLTANMCDVKSLKQKIKEIKWLARSFFK